MTLKQGIEERNLPRIKQYIETARFKYGWNYTETYDLAFQKTGISLPDWDELVMEAEDA
jgi:hypothetical protein